MARSAEYDLIINFLGHNWVTIDEMYSVLSDKILPGKAKRKYQELFEKGAANRTGAAPVKGPLPDDRQIASGARSILRGALRSAVEADTVQQKKVGDVTFVRLNVFSANDIDAIIANQVGEVIAIATAVESQSAPDPIQLTIFDMLIDIRSVKNIPVTATGKQVVFTIPNIVEGQDFSMFLSPEAADYLSDQLGFQALVVRNGKENGRKAIPAKFL